MLQARFYASIAEIEPSSWDGLFASDNPFCRHDFLLALEESGCVSPEAGWQPQHLALYREEQLLAVMPLYLKTHSYGEFVFDWGWAEAYERHGLDYYPKLLTAIPFTPSTGPRAGFSSAMDKDELIAAMLSAIRRRSVQLGCSGWHLLFPDESLAGRIKAGQDPGVLYRRDLQFHWINRDYRSFDDYLSVLRSSRRKNLKRERRLVAEQGVTLERKTGNQIDEQDWTGFYQCYRTTYLKRSGHPGYLSKDFFDKLLKRMPEQLMLVVAKQANELVASALFLFDRHRLYGRYWGALTDIRCMHFEACFYQGIEFCIENGIAQFDPGTQGEHKLLRGFEPHETCSFHWIADQGFSAAIAQFLERERQGTKAYSENAAAFLPFRNASLPVKNGH